MKKLFIAGLVCLSPALLFSQYYWDVGLSAGASNYLGEMGGKEQTRRDFVMDMKLNQTRWAVGGFGRYRFMNSVAANLAFNWIRVQGADRLSTNPQRYARNLSFRNDLLELSLTAEYYFYRVNDVGRHGRYLVDMKAYIFGGVAGFYNNPKAEMTPGAKDWVKLRPLNLENLPKPYSIVSIGLPVGVGLFYTYKRKHRFGWNVSWRTTFTDYIDDASTVYAGDAAFSDPTALALHNRTDELPSNDPIASAVSNGTDFHNFYGSKGALRGDPSHKDSYITTQFTYSYVIRGHGNFYRSKFNYVYGNKRRKRRTRAKF